MLIKKEKKKIYSVFSRENRFEKGLSRMSAGEITCRSESSLAETPLAKKTLSLQPLAFGPTVWLIKADDDDNDQNQTPPSPLQPEQ